MNSIKTERFYLKKWLPILQADKMLLVGIPGTTQYHEEVINENIILRLEQLIHDGIDNNDIEQNELYSSLYKKELLTTEWYNEKTKRNTLYFDYLNIPKMEKSSYNKKRILIFGAGAGGSTLCYLLAQLGFSNIVIVDNDKVEQSEIEKTLIYRYTDIGNYKVAALKEIILNNFGFEIETFNAQATTSNDIENIIKTYLPDFVVKACDPDLSFRIFLNDVCFKYSIPFIYMAYSFEFVNIGPLFIPGITDCDRGFNKFIIDAYGENQDFMKLKKLYTNYTIHPSINFNINILASIIAKEIIFYFLKKNECLISMGKVVYFNPLKLQGTALPIKCNYENCICKTNN